MNISQYSPRLSISGVCNILGRHGIEMRRTTIAHYVKVGVLPPPEGMHYTHEHVARLYIIAVLREVYSLAHISKALDMAGTSMQQALGILENGLAGCPAPSGPARALGLMAHSCAIKREAIGIVGETTNA